MHKDQTHEEHGELLWVGDEVAFDADRDSSAHLYSFLLAPGGRVAFTYTFRFEVRECAQMARNRVCA